jgi:hypothetical protein
MKHSDEIPDAQKLDHMVLSIYCRSEKGNSSALKFGSMDPFAIKNEEISTMNTFKT